MPVTDSSQYREIVLAQVRVGRSVYDLADGLEVSAATIFRWMKQDQTDWARWLVCRLKTAPNYEQHGHGSLNSSPNWRQ